MLKPSERRRRAPCRICEAITRGAPTGLDWLCRWQALQLARAQDRILAQELELIALRERVGHLEHLEGVLERHNRAVIAAGKKAG